MDQRAAPPAAAPSSLAPIPHRRLLDTIAASVPRDQLPRIEAATVTHLLRPVPWRQRSGLTSVASSRYPALAIRTANVIDQNFPGVHVAKAEAIRVSDDRQCFEVLVATSLMADVADWLGRLWYSAAEQVAARTRHGQRVAAARTIWRAALLVSSSDRRRAQIRVSVPDPATLTVLHDAGNALGISVRQHRRRGNSYFATVDDPAHAVRLLHVVGAGRHAEEWVCHPHAH